MSDIIVFDMEWTAWEGSQQRRWSRSDEHREIVQIGAVRLDSKRFDELRSLKILVKPSVNITLSKYFVELTGITQAHVDKYGISLENAIQIFKGFVDGAAAIFSNGGDEEVFQENCDLIGIRYTLGEAPFYNAHPLLIECTGLSSDAIVSSKLPELLGIPTVGSSHDALADARALAASLIEFGLLPTS